VRKIVVGPLLALALIVPAAAPALAHSGAGFAHSGHSTPTTSATSTPTTPGKNAVGDHGRPARTMFEGGGLVTAVDSAAGTFSLQLDGRKNHRLRGLIITVTVNDATHLRRNKVAAKLSDVLVGDRVTVDGVKNGTTYIAHKVCVTSLNVHPTATPTPTETPTSAPTASPTPTDTPTATTSTTAATTGPAVS